MKQQCGETAEEVHMLCISVPKNVHFKKAFQIQIQSVTRNKMLFTVLDLET